MAKFNQAVMTDKGAELLVKVMAENCGIEFTKIEIGSGVYSDAEKEKEYLKKRENLKDSQKTYGFNSISIKNGNAVSLKTLITNQDIEKGFRVTEMGVFAKKKDAAGEEVLYSVAVAQEADYLPDKESPIEIIQEYCTTISNAEKVAIKFEQGTYALAEDVHKIKYPEYTESLNLQELEEKESIFTALGKIKTAVKNLIKHINDKNNPHSITKKQLGLENVNNTSDKEKPVSEATQTALDKYYSQLTAYTDKEIADLIGGAPTTMDTLKEVADAITENKSIQEALDAAIGTKADKAEFDSHTKNKNNPHGVTKAQVGLGNVPNVSTNDQTPTFTQATTRSNLVSGEKTSVSFGKIMKWFSDLKTGAFMTVVNNDTTTAEGYVADARIVKTHGDEIDALKKSVSDGKKSVAVAITAQGVNTATDAEFSTMATNIKTVGTNKYNAGVVATKKGTATAGQVLTGYTFTNSSGVGLSGSMPNRGALNWNPGGSTSYAVPAGYYSGGTISSSAAYSQGVTDADNRPNGNSVNYISGYNAGVAAADNRANPGSVNYQTGYNNGYGAGAASKPTIYTGSTNVWVSKGHEYPVIQHPAANSFAISNAVSNDDYNNLWVRIRSNTTTAATLHCSGQGNSEGTVTINWIAW